MKLKSLIFVCLMGLFVSAFAENRHVPVFNEQAKSKPTAQKAQMAGPCQIEVVNQSDYSLKVYGDVLDYYYNIIGIVDPFYVPFADYPHTIDLRDVYGYCSAYGMHVYVVKLGSGWFGMDEMVYDRDTRPGTTIVIR